MFHWPGNRLRFLSAALVAVLTSLWLAGACAAVSAPCDSPCPKSGTSQELMTPCQQALAPCDLPVLNAPPAASLDFSVTPVVLAALPIDFSSASFVPAPPENWRNTRPPPTPLYLTHLALLN